MSTPTAPGGPARFFATVRSTDVRRSEDRWFAGVCGGIADRLGLDPLLVRGVLVALTAVGGLGLAFYGVCWLLLPDGRVADDRVGDRAGDDRSANDRSANDRDGGRIEGEAVLRGDVSGSALLAGALVVADLVLPRALVGLFTGGWTGPGWGFLVTGLLVPLGWWLLHDYPFPKPLFRTPDPVPTPAPATQPLSLLKDAPPAAAPASPAEPQAGFGSPTERRAMAREQAREKARESAERARENARVRADQAAAKRRPGSPLLTSAVLGLALLAAGGVVVADLLVGFDGATLTLALCAAVAVMGLGAVVAGLRSRRTALVGLAWPLALWAAVVAVLPPAQGWTWEFAQTWRPTGAAAVSTAVGQLRVDPSAVQDASATMAAGRIDVLVPDGSTVVVDVRVLAGSIRWQDGAEVVEIAAPDTFTQEAAPGGSWTTGGVDVHRMFAVGPDAASVAAGVDVRGDDPADWTVPAGTPELQTVTWAGEVRLGPANSSTMEQR